MNRVSSRWMPILLLSEDGRGRYTGATTAASRRGDLNGVLLIHALVLSGVGHRHFHGRSDIA